MKNIVANIHTHAYMQILSIIIYQLGKEIRNCFTSFILIYKIMSDNTNSKSQ